MEKIIEAMNVKIEILKKRIKKSEDYLKKTTDGWLRITRSAGKPRYYQITQSGETTGKYLKQNELNIAQDLAQKDYYQKYIVKAQKDISRLSKALEMLKSASGKSVYNSLNVDRRKLITPFDLSDEEYAKQW